MMDGGVTESRSSMRPSGYSSSLTAEERRLIQFVNVKPRPVYMEDYGFILWENMYR